VQSPLAQARPRKAHGATRAPAALRLYVSVASDLELRPLLDGLKRRAEPYVLSDVAPLSAEILHSLRLAIQRADQVRVVLGEAPAPNPMFGAGLVLGLGKPFRRCVSSWVVIDRRPAVR
jgi:hypothetical protein